MEERTIENRELGPTYKALFLGCCILISGAFGWWLTHFVSTVEYLHRDYERRLSELEARADREKWEHERLKEELRELRNHERKTTL